MLVRRVVDHQRFIAARCRYRGKHFHNGRVESEGLEAAPCLISRRTLKIRPLVNNPDLVKQSAPLTYQSGVADVVSGLYVVPKRAMQFLDRFTDSKGHIFLSALSLPHPKAGCEQAALFANLFLRNRIGKE